MIYIDDGTTPRLIELQKQNGKVVEKVIKTYPARNSVGIDETKEVLADAFDPAKYPAKNYGLVYWSHGDGWFPAAGSTRWVGADGSNEMNITDLSQILASGPHLDFLMFDACFMSSVEVAYELRDYTDYIIGSPTEIPGPGAKYDVVVPALFANTDAAAAVAAAYYEPYAATYDGGINNTNDNWTGGVSTCMMATKELDNLAAATRQLVAGATYQSSIRNTVFDYDKYSSAFTRGHLGYYDLQGLMQALAVDNDAYNTWLQAFHAARPYWEATSMNFSAAVGMFSMNGANGISCYIPTGKDNAIDQAYRDCSWYVAAGLSQLGW
jgi:hypothetical protein